MKIRKFLSTLLACMLLSSLLPSAEAVDCAIYDAYAAPASVTAHPAENAGPRSFMTARADEAAEDGGAFHPYVFTVDENASVSARVQLQPALMVLTKRGAPLTGAAPDVLEGDGSVDNPYRIGTDTQLEKFRDIVNTDMPVACAVLTADIDLGNAPWTPIPFYSGVFDGCGYTISGLNVTGGQDAGLFGSVAGSGALVRRLGVQGSVSASSATGSAFVGGIAGTLTDHASISECWFEGSVHASVSDSASSSSGAFAGGIVGYSNYHCNVSNCYSVGPVRAEAAGDNDIARAGGIAGYCEGETLLSFCYHAEGKITATAAHMIPRAGGIVGNYLNAPPVQCYYLTGTANSGVGNREDFEGVTDPLSADEFGKPGSFIVIDSPDTWDFDDIWYMDKATARPRLYCGKQESHIEFGISESIPFGVTMEIDFYTPENATGSITVTLSCKEANETFSPVNITDGKASLNITPRYGGDHTLTAVYSGDDQFLPCEFSREFRVVGGPHAYEWDELQDVIKFGNVDVVLAGNVTCENQTLSCLEIPTNCNVTLDLHSFTIDHGLTNGSIFYVRGNLTIMDSVGGGAITGGNATDGGAVYVANGGSLSISNVTFSNNAAQFYGGAIFAAPGASLSVIDCAFINNTANSHSAVSLRNAAASISRSVFINNTAAAGVVGSLDSSHVINNVTNCIFVGNKADGGVFIADNENASTDFNWFGQTAKDYTINQDAQAAKAWYFVNLTRTIDNTTGQYAFNAALGAYNSTSRQAVKISSENYPLPTIMLDGGVRGADIDAAEASAGGIHLLTRGAENNASGAVLMLSRAGYSSVNFTPSVDSTNYTVSFSYPGHPEIYQNLTFVRTIRVNENNDTDMFTFNDTESGPIAVVNLTALENGEAVPNAVLKNKTVSVAIGDEVSNYTLTGDGVFEMSPGNATPGIHESLITVAGFVPLAVNITAPKYHTPLNVTAPEYVVIGEDVLISAQVPENATGNVTMNIRGGAGYDETYCANITDGKGAVTVSGLPVGTYTANITYPGDDNYLENATSVSFRVVEKSYTVALSASPPGGGSVTGAGNHTGGSDVTVTAAPNTGYDFVSWKENGAVVSENATYVFPAIANRTLTAVFARKTFAVSFLNEDGTALQNCTVAYGDTPVYSGGTPEKAEDGWYIYTFAGWTPAPGPVFKAINYTATFNATEKTTPAPAPSYDYAPPAPKETRFDEVDLSKGSLDNFKRSRTYTDGLFSDVDPKGWYFENVAAAYEFALMEGMGDGTFGVGARLKLSEALALACRMHNIYYGGSGRFDQTKDANWYTVYEDYAVKYGIIQKGEYDLTKDATRAQFAAIISAALPDAALKPINDVKELPDMRADDPRLPAILRLYNAGILTGMDGQGSFRPDASIPREQIAAMATRVADPALRKAFTLS